MPNYSYAECLENSYKVNWTIQSVIGGRDFDLERRWLPDSLSGADGISCLDDAEKIKLSHVEMGAYAHLFGYVEEFIAPTMIHLAQDFEIDHREGFDALTNFAAEEVKHMILFREVRALVDKKVGFSLALIEGKKEVAKAVLSKNVGAVLLLIAAIEWFAQLHYLSGFQDNGDLDPFTQAIFKAHWQEESQHARMDHLEILRAFEGMSDEEKEQAIDDLIEPVAAVDALLHQQVDHDITNLSQYLDRTFTEEERDELAGNILRAKRYTFIESGVTHPNFLEAFAAVTTPEQQEKVQGALGELLAS